MFPFRLPWSRAGYPKGREEEEEEEEGGGHFGELSELRWPREAWVIQNADYIGAAGLMNLL